MLFPLQQPDTTSFSDKEKSAFRNISYSKQNLYYRKAKEQGFRARSVYKLKEIHSNFNILSSSSKYLDLCAAPGSWSQMLRLLTKSIPNSKIVSVDIQDIVPIEGVDIIKGDITSQSTIEEILKCFNNEKVDVVIFDGAPDVTGLIDIDMYMQVDLIIFALVICMKLLKKNGKFVAKIFKVDVKETNEMLTSSTYAVKSDFYYEKVKVLFDNVYYYKPASSRSSSHESFLVCEGFGIDNKEIENEITKMSMNDLFNFETNVTNTAVKDFLRFLIKGGYTL